jgi:hypothetical protein
MVNELRFSRTAARAECIFSRRAEISGTGSCSSVAFWRFFPEAAGNKFGNYNNVNWLTSSASKSQAGYLPREIRLRRNLTGHDLGTIELMFREGSEGGCAVVNRF